MEHQQNLTDAGAARWNNRFSQPGYAYGEEPNNYLREQLLKLPPGTALFPAEGEGRNAVFAASLGWRVTAFDISEAGKNKALQLAGKHKVSIDYRVGTLESHDFQDFSFDAIGLIYSHFSPAVRWQYHKKFDGLLKPGGTIILEGFSKKNLDYVALNPGIGGPKDYETLFSIDEIQSGFPNYEIIELAEKVVELHEGLYHNGTGSVIRFTGRKKQ